MNKDNLRKEFSGAYEKLVRGTPYLVLLISFTTSVALSILGNGIIGILMQLFPLLILIGLYIARSGNQTGVKMVRICASFLFWIYCILCGLLLSAIVVFLTGNFSTNNAQAALISGVGGILLAGLVFLKYFFPIFYYRDIRMITKDIEGWFVNPAGPASKKLPAESQKRVNCRLTVLCIIQIVLNGITAIYMLSMLGRNSLIANLGGNVLNGMTDSSFGTQVIGMLMPGQNIFAILAEAGIITKFVCIILLYKQYQQTEAKAEPKIDVKKAPVDKKRDTPVAPPKQTKKTKIIMERKTPKGGRFSAYMTTDMIVGRIKDEADLVLPDDQSISGRHLKLFIRNNKLYGEDMNSHNGTYINGRKITGTAQIHRGDEIRLGNSVFTLTWET